MQNTRSSNRLPNSGINIKKEKRKKKFVCFTTTFNGSSLKRFVKNFDTKERENEKVKKEPKNYQTRKDDDYKNGNSRKRKINAMLCHKRKSKNNHSCYEQEFQYTFFTYVKV